MGLGVAFIFLFLSLHSFLSGQKYFCVLFKSQAAVVLGLQRALKVSFKFRFFAELEGRRVFKMFPAWTSSISSRVKPRDVLLGTLDE